MPSNAAIAVMDRIPAGMARRTRFVYDVLAGIYPLSSYLFHTRAQKTAIAMSGLRDGMNVLEIATGSGELFARLLDANPNGCTAGIDLSPRMAAHTLRKALSGKRRGERPPQAICSAADVCQLPFADSRFDAAFACLVFELIDPVLVPQAACEIRRTLRRGGTFTMVIIPEDESFFSRLYAASGRVVPAFWGRRVEQEILELFRQAGFRIQSKRDVQQNGYRTRVVTLT